MMTTSKVRELMGVYGDGYSVVIWCGLMQHLEDHDADDANAKFAQLEKRIDALEGKNAQTPCITRVINMTPPGFFCGRRVRLRSRKVEGGTGGTGKAESYDPKRNTYMVRPDPVGDMCQLPELVEFTPEELSLEYNAGARPNGDTRHP